MSAVPSVHQQRDFTAKGYHIVDAFLPKERCAELLAQIAEFRQHHQIAEISRPARERPLRYSVIDGDQIRAYLPEIQALYVEVNKVVNEATGENLVPLQDSKVACNINITKPNGTYRWHYDRNALTVILYLNTVEGGETDCYPNYRFFLPKLRFSRLQHWIDDVMQHPLIRRIIGRLVVVKPTAGTLFMMRGNRSLHSVRPVTSDFERINVIMSYDTPGANYAVTNQLNAYIYNQSAVQSGDPNYQK